MTTHESNCYPYKNPRVTFSHIQPTDRQTYKRKNCASLDPIGLAAGSHSSNGIQEHAQQGTAHEVGEELTIDDMKTDVWSSDSHLDSSDICTECNGTTSPGCSRSDGTDSIVLNGNFIICNEVTEDVK